MKPVNVTHGAIVAAFVAAATGHACAQSSVVTIYGVADQGVAKMNNGTSIAAFPGAGNNNQWNLKHGAQPRLGFRGTEDLGDGLSAFFQLEHRLDLGDGTAGNPFWTGRSVVGLRNTRYGEVSLGRDYLPAFWPAVTVDPWGWDTVGQMGRIYTWAQYAGGDAVGIRDNNTVQYKSPDLNGFSGSLSVSAGEGGPSRGRAVGGNAVYSSGPWYVGLAFDQAKNVVASGPDAQLQLLAAAYDFDGIRPSILVSRSKSFTGVESKSLMLGLRAQIGLGQFRAAYGRVDPDGSNNTSTKVSVGYFYFLSKRTALYTDLGSAKADGLTRSTGVDAGIRHFF